MNNTIDDPPKFGILPARVPASRSGPQRLKMNLSLVFFRCLKTELVRYMVRRSAQHSCPELEYQEILDSMNFNGKIDSDIVRQILKKNTKGMLGVYIKEARIAITAYDLAIPKTYRAAERFLLTGQ